MRLNIHGLIDNAKCYQMVRQLRWPDSVECPHCHATEIIKNGCDETQNDRQRYLCHMCNRSFDDLMNSRNSVNTMEGFWSPLRSWLRPHRGISLERLPIYVGLFQFVHNVRQRGNSLLRALVEAHVCTNPERR